MTLFCDKFELSLDEGTRIYAMFEMLLGLENTLLGIQLTYSSVQLSQSDFQLPADKKRASRAKMMFMFVGVGLVAQGISGFLLYPFGYKNRNGLSCWVWIMCALFNLFSFAIAIAGVIIKITEWVLLFRLMHLIYNILGIYIIYSYNGSKSVRRIEPLSSSSSSSGHAPVRPTGHGRGQGQHGHIDPALAVIPTTSNTSTDVDHSSAGRSAPHWLDGHDHELETETSYQTETEPSTAPLPRSQPPPPPALQSPHHRDRDHDHHHDRDRDHHHHRGEHHHRVHRSR